MTKYHSLFILNTRNILSHSSRDQKSKMKGLIFLKASLFGLQIATFSLCPHVVFFLCLHAPGICPLLYHKDTRHIELGPTLT